MSIALTYLLPTAVDLLPSAVLAIGVWPALDRGMRVIVGVSLGIAASWQLLFGWWWWV